MASKSNELRLVDKRTVTNNIKLGFIQKEEVTNFIKALPDEAGNFDEIPLEDEIEAIDEIADDFDDEIADEADSEAL